jgi:hypothetical protein
LGVPRSASGFISGRRLSRAREALAARSQMGRWTYTFTRCPVSVAAYSETKISLNNTESRAWRLRFAVETRHKQKKGILDRKTIRRVSIYFVRRPEASFY